MSPSGGQKEAFSRVVIDAQLADVGWDLTDGQSVRYEYQLPDGTFADYILSDRHGRAMAVVEAKRAAVNLQEAADQGRTYAEQLDDVPCGGTPSKKNPAYWGGVIPWVSPKDMKSDYISDSIDHVAPKALEETTLKWIPAESVLIVVRGMILMHTVPIRINSSRITINQDMKALVPNEELSANYLRWALQCMHSYVLSQVSTSAHGTRKLDTDRLLALRIPLPPLTMQEEFNMRLGSIQSVQHQQEAARNSAEYAFQSLLGRAFSG